MVGSVSAASESDDLQVTNDTDTVSTGEDAVVSVDDSGEVLGDAGTFTELSQLINDSTGNLKLQKNYVYNSATDSAFKNGILINRTIDLTINGLTNSIDGNGEARIFNVISGNVKIMDLTFKNSVSTSSQGAVYWTGSNGELLRCTFTNNIDTNYGALNYNGADGKITDCTFTENYATTNGGAVLLQNGATDVVMSGCTFERNYALQDYGALYVNVEYADVLNCTFNENYAIKNGGAIYWAGTRGELRYCNFTSNYANNYGAVFWSKDLGIISNCNFNNNYAITSVGALYISQQSCMVLNCTFDSNQARGGNTGALFFNSARGYVIDCNFTNNSASGNFGGYYSSANFGYVQNCNFFYNNATNAGAASSSAGNPRLINCTFKYNHATENGGAIWVSCGVFDCVFENNTADNLGGAIYTRSDSLVLTSNTFTNNKALNGSAIAAVNNKVYIGDSEFNSNVATENGGAIYSIVNYVVVENSTFTNNKATLLGGAIYDTGDYFSEIGCTFTSNTATSKSGAIYIASGKKVALEYTDSNYVNASDRIDMPTELTINSTGTGEGSDSEITWTYALTNIANGGIIYVNSGTYTFTEGISTGSKTVKIIGKSSVTLDFNDASASYGSSVIYLSGPKCLLSNLTIKNVNVTPYIINGGSRFTTIQYCTFEDNIKSINPGGRFWTFLNCTFKNNKVNDNLIRVGYDNIFITNCLFENNSITSGNGGVMFPDNSWEITGCIFINNTAENGGVIYTDRFLVKISDCEFYNNSASENGGAICFADAADPTISNCIFSGNNASYGGAIYSSGGNVIISNSIFDGNNAYVDGGAIYSAGRDVSVINSNFTNNNASSSGGAVYSTGRDLSISDSNFTGNDASEDGGAVYSTGQDTSVSGSDFSGNSAESDGGAIYSGGSGTIISGSNFTDNSASSGGALYSNGSDASVSSSSFGDNSASSGSSIAAGSDASITVEESDFNDNSGSGGVIYSESGSEVIVDMSTTNLDDSDLKGSGIVKTERILYVDCVTGGTGDGTSESSPTDLMTAITYIASGGEIRLLAGTYEIGSVITVSKTFNITGWQNGVKITNARSGQLLHVTADDISIKNIEFTDIKDEYIVIDGKNVLIEECKFTAGNTNTNNYAMVSTSSSATGFTLRKSNFTGFKYHYVVSLVGDEATVDGCIFSSSNVATNVASDYIINVASSNSYVQNTNFSSNNVKLINLGASQSGNSIVNIVAISNNIGTGSSNGLIDVNSVISSIDGAVFSDNTANSLIYWAGSATGGTLNNADFTASNTGGTYKNLNCAASDLTLTNNKFVVSSASFNTVTSVTYPGDLSITGTFNVEGTNVYAGAPICADGTFIASPSITSSKTFSYTWTGQLPDTYTLTFGSTDSDGNTYTYSSTPTSKSATVNRISDIYISSEGGGTGLSADSPTTWDDVSILLSDDGTVHFANGVYDDFNLKTVNKGWTLTGSSASNVILNGNGNSIFTVSASGVNIEKLTLNTTGRAISSETYNVNVYNSVLYNQIELNKADSYTYGDAIPIGCTFLKVIPSALTAYVNGVEFGTASGSPYTITKNGNLAVGSYTLSATKKQEKRRIL